MHSRNLKSILAFIDAKTQRRKGRAAKVNTKKIFKNALQKHS